MCNTYNYAQKCAQHKKRCVVRERAIGRRQSDQLLADLPSGFKFSDFQQKLTNAEEKSHFLENTPGKC